LKSFSEDIPIAFAKAVLPSEVINAFAILCCLVILFHASNHSVLMKVTQEKH